MKEGTLTEQVDALGSDWEEFKALNNKRLESEIITPSLRDMFAMHAMQGFLNKSYGDGSFSSIAKQIAVDSYEVADAMLEERN